MILENINIILSKIIYGNKEFDNFVEEVKKDFNENKEQILEHIEKILRYNDIKINIIKLELFGSYASGKAREDSDIDLLLEYTGNYREDDIFNILHGKIYGIGGVYDIFPRRVD